MPGPHLSFPRTGVTPRDEAGILEAASVPAPEMPLNLDYVVDETTALTIDGRVGRGHARGAMATVKSTRRRYARKRAATPMLEEGLHAVRAEVQRLGFDVYPDDGFYAPRPAAEDIDYGHEEPPTLDEIVFDQEGPDELEAPSEPEEPDARTSSTSEPEAILHERRAHA